MKNDRITLSQFSFSMFLSLLSALMFIKGKPSVLNLIAAVAPPAIDLLIAAFYKGGAPIAVKAALAAYMFAYCVLVAVSFCRFLYKDLGYGPYWGLALVSVGFAYFCSVKGIEPLARASVIISVFVFAALIYVTALSLFKVEPEFEFEGFSGFALPFSLLLPAAAHVLLYDNIILEKKYTPYIIFGLLLVVIVFYYLLPDDKAAVGIFKGADGLLSAVLSVASAYSLSTCAQAVVGNTKKRELLAAVFLGAVFAAAVVFLYCKI